MTGELLSYDEARAAGLRHFQGVPCAKGHSGERYISDRSCVPCKLAVVRPPTDKKRAADRAKYAADPTRRRAQLYAARAANPNYEAKHAAWYAARPGYHRGWYAKNAPREREKVRRKRAANPDAFTVSGHNRRARQRNAEGTHNAEDIARLRVMQKDRCAYCRARLKGKGHVDHIIPLAAGGTNWPNNLQLLCQPCNSSKSARDPLVFARSMGRLI